MPDQWLTAARDDVHRYLSIHGPGDHNLVDIDQWDCPNLQAFAEDPQLEDLLRSLTTPDPEDSARDYIGRVLRILDGSGDVDSQPNVWHYDSCSVTMVIPIVVPQDGTGQLVVFPNSRPHRTSAMVSAAEQLLTRSDTYTRRTLQRYPGSPEDYAVPFLPGDVYLFRGYRSLHGTLPWPAGTLRATLVLQYGRPYGEDTQLLRAARVAKRRWRQSSLRNQTCSLPTV